MSTTSIPYIVLLGFVFGSTLVISRFSVGQFAPSTYVGLRLSLASIAFLLMYALFPRRYAWPKDRQLWLRADILGVIGTAVLALSGESGLPDVTRANPLGYILMTTGILFGNAAAVYLRKYLTSYHVNDVAAIRLFVAAIIVTPLSLLFFKPGDVSRLRDVALCRRCRHIWRDAALCL